LRCKSRLFSDTRKRFLSLFLKKKPYSLNYSEIDFYKGFSSCYLRPASIEA